MSTPSKERPGILPGDDNGTSAVALRRDSAHVESAAPPPAPLPPPRKEEDRIPLIWRLSFGALLSLVALVSITLYHQLNSGIGNLRTELNQLNVKTTNSVNKDEFNTRMMDLNTCNATLLSSIKNLEQANSAVLALRERSALLEQQLKAAENDRKDLAREVQRLREQLVALEARRAAESSGAAKPK